MGHAGMTHTMGYVYGRVDGLTMKGTVLASGLSRRGGRPTDEALPSRVKEGGQMQGSFEPS